MAGLAIDGINSLIPAADDHKSFRDRGRGVEKLLPSLHLELPGDFSFFPVDSQNLAAHGADVKLLADHGHGRSHLAAERNSAANLIAVIRVDNVEGTVTAGRESAVAHDSGRPHD